MIFKSCKITKIAIHLSKSFLNMIIAITTSSKEVTRLDGESDSSDGEN